MQALGSGRRKAEASSIDPLRQIPRSSGAVTNMRAWLWRGFAEPFRFALVHSFTVAIQSLAIVRLVLSRRILWRLLHLAD